MYSHLTIKLWVLTTVYSIRKFEYIMVRIYSNKMKNNIPCPESSSPAVQTSAQYDFFGWSSVDGWAEQIHTGSGPVVALTPPAQCIDDQLCICHSSWDLLYVQPWSTQNLKTKNCCYYSIYLILYCIMLSMGGWNTKYSNEQDTK